jgi:hypothetical protein
MTKRKAFGLTVAFNCCFMVSCMNVIVHDQNSAARAATEFARIAFVDRDYTKAFSLLAPRSRPYITLEKLSETIPKMHPKSFPSQVTATEYEPMPGQSGMTIYVKGDGEGEEFFYRLVMDGDASSGYQVSGLFRGNGPNPSTNKQPLSP